MEVIKTLSPGVNGTKRYVKLYGEKLVCVRYRMNKETGDRYTTIELIVDESLANDPSQSQELDASMLKFLQERYKKNLTNGNND